MQHRLYVVKLHKGTHGMNEVYKVIATTYQDCINKAIESGICEREEEIKSINDDAEVII